MVARVVTVAFDGVEARRVDVEVQQVATPAGAFAIVGLPDKAVAESRERVRGAFAGIGLALPPKKVIANLAPADLPKEGSHFDLPIALALLASMGVIAPDALDGWAAVGELGLDGRIAAVGGTFPAAMAVGAMGLGLICPEANGPEAAWAGEVAILAPRSLIGLINHFRGTQILRTPDPGPVTAGAAGPDLREVKGQESAKRALEIAAAGGHNLLRLFFLHHVRLGRVPPLQHPEARKPTPQELTRWRARSRYSQRPGLAQSSQGAPPIYWPSLLIRSEIDRALPSTPSLDHRPRL